MNKLNYLNPFKFWIPLYTWTAALALSFALAFPKIKRVQRLAKNLKNDDWWNRIKHVSEIIYYAIQIIFAGIIDVITNVVYCFKTFRKWPKDIFLTQTVQRIIDRWERPAYLFLLPIGSEWGNNSVPYKEVFNERQIKYLKQVIKIANEVDNDEDGTEKHFTNVPEELQ